MYINSFQIITDEGGDCLKVAGLPQGALLM